MADAIMTDITGFAGSGATATTVSVSAATTVSIFAPGYDMANVGASVVKVEDAYTVYSLGCLDGSDPNDNELCGFLYGPTVTQGPSTWAVSTELVATHAKKTYTQSIGCELDKKKNEASCTMRADQPKGYDAPSSTQDSIKGYTMFEYPVPVTSGADKLDAKATGGSNSKSDSKDKSADKTGTTTDSSDGASQTGGGDGDSAASSKTVSLFGLLAVVGVVSALL